MSRVLVTGASGFIGSAVVAALARDGYAVRAAVRRPHLSFPDGVEVVQHPDLAEAFDWQPLLQGVDQVVHLAGIAHTGRGVDRASYDRVNRQATAQLATAAAQAGVKHLVFVSSIRAQCGPAADHALTERDDPAPADAYGASKLAAEEAVRSSGVPFTILRPALLYGPGVKGNFALLARAAATRLPLPVRDFSNRRSLLGIDNFISALAFVLATPATIGETYVVADPGIPPRLSDVFVTLRQARGRRALIIPMSPDYIELPLRLFRRADVWHRIGGNLRVDAGKLIAAGWRPAHDTRGGLAAMVQAAAPRKSGTASRNTR
ncbi:MAG TPA: NAD-dependent epimerase/dehydratase family protein [Xanthobacteraceae bacterium]|jgi:nucleoside-diphosphate-sugar epimerase|nr:NAD-dependent epimerase/dehydratase family protein [Xanthobacteraceae bacterium]